MSDYRSSPLQAVSALTDTHHGIGTVLLREQTDRALVSIAFSPDRRTNVSDSLLSTLGCTLPEVGSSTFSGDTQLLGLQLDQVWWMGRQQHDHFSMDRYVANKTGAPEGVWFTDQSDGWVVLRSTGKALPAVVERLVSLDMSLRAFPAGSVARTVAEHIAVILLRHDDQTLDWITPRSSVMSLTHAFATAATHVHNELQLTR